MEYERPGISFKEGEWSENRSLTMELRGRCTVRSSKEHCSRREFGLPKESKVRMAEVEGMRGPVVKAEVREVVGVPALEGERDY